MCEFPRGDDPILNYSCSLQRCLPFYLPVLFAFFAELVHSSVILTALNLITAVCLTQTPVDTCQLCLFMLLFMPGAV